MRLLGRFRDSEEINKRKTEIKFQFQKERPQVKEPPNKKTSVYKGLIEQGTLLRELGMGSTIPSLTRRVRCPIRLF